MKLLKPILRILLIIVIAALMLGLILATVMIISSKHRSDPEDIKNFETSNPLITERTEISAHRSGAGIAPEETLMALKYCAENKDFGVDVFEFDLHITRDEKLVLLHDDTLDRTSDSEAVFGEAEVRPENKTLAELKKLNMGAKFALESGEMPYAELTGDAVPDDLRILTVEEALDYLMSVDDYKYIIEIKNGGELGMKGVDILYSVLEERDIIDKVAFGTFNEEVSAYVDENYKSLARSTSIKEVLNFYIAALTDSKTYEPPCTVLQIPFCAPYLNYGINLGTAKVINYAHSHNMAVQYWTVNDEADLEYLVSVGADCIMTDYPDRLFDIMN